MGYLFYNFAKALMEDNFSDYSDKDIEDLAQVVSNYDLRTFVQTIMVDEALTYIKSNNLTPMSDNDEE